MQKIILIIPSFFMSSVYNIKNKLGCVRASDVPKIFS